MRVFAEKRTGRTAERPELQACLDYLRPGDTLVVVSLDRLSRSLADLITLVADLRRHGGFRTCTRRWTPPRPQGASMIAWPLAGRCAPNHHPTHSPLTRSLHGHGGRGHTRQAGEAAATTGNRPTPRRSP